MQKLFKITAGLALGFFLLSNSAFARITVQYPEKDFPDIHPSDEYFYSMKYLGEIGVFTGDGGTEEFRPNDDLKRAELPAVLFRLTGEKESEKAGKENCFLDVRQEWYANYVCWAKEKGYVKGYNAGEYWPAEPLVYAELITTLSKLFEWDTSEGLRWYEPAWNFAEEANLLTGGIKPEGNVVREEMAEIILRTLVINEFDLEVYTDEDWYNSLPRGEMQMLYDGYSKDWNNVYMNDEIVEGADPESFEHFGGMYAKDAEHVFIGTALVEGVDADHFEYLGGVYGRDDKNIYVSTSHQSFEVLFGADLETFEVISDDDLRVDSYAKDQNHVYQNEIIFEGADPASFRATDLWDAYIDDKHFYYHGFIYPWIDVNSFAVLTDERGRTSQYVKDDNAVYFDSYSSLVELPDADLESFEAVFMSFDSEYGFGSYAQDKNHVYKNGVMFLENEEMRMAE